MLKKLILIFAGVLVSANVLSAQAPDRYGIKIGYGASGTDFDYQNHNFSGSQDAYLAPDISLLVEWDIEPWLDFSIEPGLVHRGYKRDITSFFYPFGSTGGSQVKMHYFSIPMLVKVKPFDWYLTPFLEAGPRIDVLLSRDINNAENYERHVFEEYNQLTAGYSLGVGLEFSALPEINISMGYRLNMDLFNSYADESITVKNEASAFWIGVSHRL